MQIKRKKEGNCRNTARMKLTSNQKYIANGSNNAILTFYGEKEHKERPTNKPSIGTTEPLPRVEGVLEGCERISVWRVWPDPIPIGRRLSDRDGLLQGAERAAQPPQRPRQHSIGTTEPLPRVEGVLEGCERISVLSPASPGWSSFEHPGRVPPTTMRRKEKGQWPAKAQA